MLGMNKLKNYLKRTKDRRLKFDLIVGKSLINIIIILSVLFMIFQLIDKVFSTNISSYNLSVANIAMVTILSFHFARLNYNFHYQKEQVDKVTNHDNMISNSFHDKYEDFSKLYWFNKINYLTLLIGGVTFFFGITMLPIFVLSQKYISPLTALILIIMLFFFCIVLMYRNFKATDFNEFSKLWIGGIMTDYAKEGSNNSDIEDINKITRDETSKNNNDVIIDCEVVETSHIPHGTR